MPYITQNERDKIDPWLDARHFTLDEGQLNYVITKLIVDTLGTSPRYRDFNAVLGVLECAKLELYRMVVAEYEDGKALMNGDVYEGLSRGPHYGPYAGTS